MLGVGQTLTKSMLSPMEATNGSNEGEAAPSSENTPSETALEPETEEEPTTVAKRLQKPSLKQMKTKPLPSSLRNKGRRRMQPWIWVLMALLVLVLFLERVSNIAYNIVNGVCYPVNDQSAPVYITLGDGGNLEGLATNMTEPQPQYSAYREASFGHAIFDIKNRTHAYYSWHRNQDGNALEADSLWFFNRYWNPLETCHDTQVVISFALNKYQISIQ
ncbi:hypothetical protein HHK36_008585 [Tetracentron sinense]|uniref:Purple acid phosphatase C-terminal domain-containing protein n=1 Tax=Tetracentron sinense TaxID=13715 RepID=A0A834ZGL9_TETSI|nr:hypothetical protein HHK36_008585 [Tetracentron sinense]